MNNEILELLESITAEIQKLDENIFGYNDGRGDLLADIDRGLGSPIKKAKDRFVERTLNVGAPKPIKVKPQPAETKNKQIGMNRHKDKTVGPKPTVKNAIKQAEG